MSRARISLLAAAGLVIAIAAGIQLTCEEPFEVHAAARMTGDETLPYMVEGSITGCGIYRLRGVDEFGFALRSGGPPAMSRTRSGADVITVRAEIPQAGRTAVVDVTVERGGRVVSSTRSSVALPASGSTVR